MLATPATLKGDKYQLLINELFQDRQVLLTEQACPGLVEQIEKGEISSSVTKKMLKIWLEPMKKNRVDTIVLGCTHYPLVSDVIKEIMGYNITLIQTGSAIAQRLMSLSLEQNHLNKGLLNIFVYSTGNINDNMINKIFEKTEYYEKITIRKYDI